MPHVYRWQYDDNNGERSVRLFHVHVFIETDPYSYIPHPDKVYVPLHLEYMEQENERNNNRDNYNNSNNESNNGSNNEIKTSDFEYVNDNIILHYSSNK